MAETVWAKGLGRNENFEMEVVVGSAGKAVPWPERCRCWTFGGISEMGKSFMPSSKRACFAILTQEVSVSYQRMFFVVFGRKPKKIPLRELV